MANAKIIERKAQVVEEIANKVKESSTSVLFEYQGLTVSETTTSSVVNIPTSSVRSEMLSGIVGAFNKSV